MKIEKTNDKMTTPIVIAISAVLVIVIIIAVALSMHLRKNAKPNNVITNRVVNSNGNRVVSRNETSTRNNTIVSNNIINNNVIVNNTITDSNNLENNNIETNTTVVDNNKVPQEVQSPDVEQPNNESISPVKLNVKGRETLENGGEFIYINDYKITIPKELVQIGYDIATRRRCFSE